MIGQAKTLFTTKQLGEEMVKNYIFNDYFVKILILQLVMFIIMGSVGAYLSSKRYMTQNS